MQGQERISDKRKIEDKRGGKPYTFLLQHCFVFFSPRKHVGIITGMCVCVCVCVCVCTCACIATGDYHIDTHLLTAD